MLKVAGYGFGGSRKVLGQGYPPEGWPDHFVQWATFKGVSRSGLKIEQLTEIITGLLRGANIDPYEHIENAQNENVNQNGNVGIDSSSNNDDREAEENNMEDSDTESEDVVLEEIEVNDHPYTKIQRT